MSDSPKFRIAAQVPRELRDRLEAHARATGRSASSVMRSLIAEHVPATTSILDPTPPVPHHFTIVWHAEDGDHFIARVAEFEHPGWHVAALDDAGRALAEKLLRTMTGPSVVVTHVEAPAEASQ
jgi:hypothetical protein